MIQEIFIFTLLFVGFTGSHAKSGFGSGEQDWGYTEVRENAEMFWWLYYTTANVTTFYEKPLIIWLQGGPGGSSTGIGNFQLIGPLDVNMTDREISWVDHYNVLFIDSPVGTGFSSVANSAYATTGEEIVIDLMSCVKEVLKRDPKLKSVETYIVGESYGGKTAIEFARVWHEAEKAGDINSTLKGVALGDPWVSPIDSVMSWAPYLLHMGMIDDTGYKIIEKGANMTKEAVERGNWREAQRLWSYTESAVDAAATQISFYNILEKMHKCPTDECMSESVLEDRNLEHFMNEKVKKMLNLTTTWGSQADGVFKSHIGDFMKPVVDQVEYVLNNTDLKVIVYNGQLDLIVDTPGTMHWVNRMQWNYSDEWHEHYREVLLVDNVIEGYIKKYKNFAVYWINRAGHMIPKDNPRAGLEMMRQFTSNESSDSE